MIDCFKLIATEKATGKETLIAISKSYDSIVSLEKSETLFCEKGESPDDFEVSVVFEDENGDEVLRLPSKIEVRGWEEGLTLEYNVVQC